MLSRTGTCITLLLGLLLFFAPPGAAAPSRNPFPEYNCLKSNVDFWVLIYSRYPSTTGVIHDRDDLNLIYGTVNLLPADAPRARRINRWRTRKASAKYAALLRRLARGAPPHNAREKKILALFGRNPSPKRLREASENVRVQLGQKDRFVEGLIRSGRYLKKIKQIFRDYGLPSDLAYIPHVESSFNYEAYSKFGAAGIWQFTRSTGRRYLTINYVVDERRDPIRATWAAAQYLKKNYELLGSWPLAITAYNNGETGMLRAKAAKGNYVRIFEEYERGCFKFASRNFYSEFLAARKVASHYRHYFGWLPLEKPQRVTTITLPGFLAVSDAISFFKVKETVLQRLNPALRPPVFAGRKYIPTGYHLRLPGSLQAGALIARIPSSVYRRAQKRSLFYTVTRGDTAGGIAAQERVKLRDLIIANNLGRRATIYIGQRLRIPAPYRHEMVAKKQAAPAKGQPPVILTASSNKTKGTKEHVAVSKASGTLPKARPGGGGPQGQPAPQKGLTASTADRLAIIRTYKRSGVRYGVIRVAPEETIGHYAEWLHLSAARIRIANRKRKGKAIITDQKLIIPLTKVSGKEFEEKRLEFHREIEEDFFAAYHVTDVTEYRIKKGDTIWELCYGKLDLPIWLLKKYNASLDFNSLHPNQKLQVPQLVSDQSQG